MESLYRKYRPLTFESVVGQQHIVSTLEHAVEEGRLSHAYLFCGPRGTGKTTMARILAKALLCEGAEGARANGASGCMPDGTCPECEAIAEGNHPDVYELDAASRTGVDNVREEIVNSVSFAPVRGAYKVYIIDEVHMLTTAAFNALLKTLEEPPSHVVFILCTTDPQKILETILSRCQRFDFHRISNEDIVGRMRYICEQEGFAYDDEALELVARHARGGMRDALSTLEQLSVFGDGAVRADDARALLGEVASTVLADFAKKIAERDTPSLFALVRSQVDEGNDLLELTRDLIAHIRDVYTASIAGARAELFDGTPEEVAAFVEEAKLFENSDRLARALTVLDDAALEMRNASDPRLVLEIALTRLARPESDLTIESLAERLSRLEEQLVAGVASAPMPTTELVGKTAAAPADASAPATASASPAPGQRPWEQAAPAPTPRARQVEKPLGESRPWERQASTASQAAPKPWEHPAPAVKKAPAPQASAVAAPAPVRPSAPVQPPVPSQPSMPVQSPASAPAMRAVPATTAASAAPAVEDAGELQRKWSEAVHKVVAAQPARGGLLQAARAVGDDGKTLTVAFPKGSAFALKMVSRPDSVAIIVPIICSVFGQRNVEYVMDGTPEPKGGPASNVAPAAPSGCASSAAEEEDPAPAPASPAAQVPVAVPAPVSPAAPAPSDRVAPVSTPMLASPAASPQVDEVSGPTIVAEPDVDAQRQAWEEEQVPYDDATIAAYGMAEEEAPASDPAQAPVAFAPAPAAQAVPAPVPAEPKRAPLGALPWETPQAVAAAAGATLSQDASHEVTSAATPAAQASPSPADPAAPADEPAPWESIGADATAEGIPQTEEEAKALIGSIFGSGVVFKPTDAE